MSVAPPGAQRRSRAGAGTAAGARNSINVHFHDVAVWGLGHCAVEGPMPGEGTSPGKEKGSACGKWKTVGCPFWQGVRGDTFAKDRQDGAAEERRARSALSDEAGPDAGPSHSRTSPPIALHRQGSPTAPTATLKSSLFPEAPLPSGFGEQTATASAGAVGVGGLVRVGKAGDVTASPARRVRRSGQGERQAEVEAVTPRVPPGLRPCGSSRNHPPSRRRSGRRRA